jgi:hypothetical protein
VDVDGWDDVRLGFHDVVVDDFPDGLVGVGGFGELLEDVYEEGLKVGVDELLLFDE